jgi:hypothetical protein
MMGKKTETAGLSEVWRFSGFLLHANARVPISISKVTELTCFLSSNQQGMMFVSLSICWSSVHHRQEH